MINLEFRKTLTKGTKILDEWSFDNSIIGTTTDGRLIYDLDLMAKELVDDKVCEFEVEAYDLISYDVMRALPFMGKGRPIIVSQYGTEE